MAPACVHDLERLMAKWPQEHRKAFSEWLAGDQPRDPGEQPPKSLQSAIGYIHGVNRCRRLATELGFTIDSGAELQTIWTSEVARALHDRMIEQASSPTTIRITLISLDRFLCALDPKINRRFLARLLKPIPRRGNARRKGERLRDSKKLFEIGIAIMDEALSRPEFDVAAAIAFRIGLQIALLSVRPYRLTVFSLIRQDRGTRNPSDVGTVLKLENGRYYLNHTPFQQKGLYRLRASANGPARHSHRPTTSSTRQPRIMKGGKHVPRRMPVPHELTSYITVYLSRVISILDPTGSIDHLWVSRDGTPLSKIQIYKDVRANTADANGRFLCPQLMRDCYVTSLSRRAPGEDLRPHETLGNSARMTSERYESSDRERSLSVGRQTSAIMQSYIRRPRN